MNPPTQASPKKANGGSANPITGSNTTKVVVATTVALTFISVWQAGAIVLNDMASTMYYIGGIAEQAIGKSAPWMVLAVMLFSYLVRSVYMESSSMFVRGGVYVVGRDSMGAHRQGSPSPHWWSITSSPDPSAWSVPASIWAGCSMS